MKTQQKAGETVMTRMKLVVVAALAALAGCSVNPVTGDRELTLVSTAGEIQMGEQNYAPMKQSQGGEYDVEIVRAPV